MNHFAPFPYQPQMLDWVDSREESALFVSPGMGKTVVTLKAIERRILDGRNKGALIVAPKRVCSITWPNQIETWAHSCWMPYADLRTPEGRQAWEEDSALVYLINYDQLASRKVQHKCKHCKGATCNRCNDTGLGDCKVTLGMVDKLIKGRKTLPVDMLVLDECFPAGTLVDTPDGPRPIEKIKIGDCVLNVSGKDSVLETYENKIERAVKIHIGGRTIVTTPRHKFFTRRGWVEAQALQEEEDEVLLCSSAMRVLRDGLRTQGEESEESILLSFLREQVNKEGEEGETHKGLCGVLHHLRRISEEAFLQHELLREMADARVPTGVFRGPPRRDEPKDKSMDGEWEPLFEESHSAHHKSMPHEKPRVGSQIERVVKKDKAQTPSPRWERKTDAVCTEAPPERTRGGLESGIRGKDFHQAGLRTTEPLQDRHRQPKQENSSGSGWSEPQQQSGEGEGRTERRVLTGQRVGRVEVLEQGDPELEKFRGADGEIRFYDLRVKAHPSYSVEGLLVHNCSIAKNPKSSRINALRAYRPKFKTFLGLTGTPVANSYLDLFAQVRILDGGARLGVSYFRFRSTYFETADYSGYRYKLRPGAKAAIDEKLADLAIVMKGEDHLDVPTTVSTDVDVVLPAKALIAYKTMEKELLLQLANKEITALSAATLVGKLLQMTGGSVYDADREVHLLHDAKIEALKKLRKQHGSEPILVLTGYRHETPRVLDAIPGARVFDEKDLPDWQAGKIHTWVANPGSLSHGIDGIQKGCRILVWYTLTHSHEKYVQACARIIRTGQTEESIVYRLICPGTIDDAVVEAVRSKADEQEGLMTSLKNLQRMRAMDTTLD